MVALPDLVIAFSPKGSPEAKIPKTIAQSQSSREAQHRAATQEYVVLIDRLKAKGLLVTARRATEGHGAEDGKIWVLIRAPEKLINELKVKERSEDFLHGVTTSPTAPGAGTDPATRLRLVYDLLTSAIEQGGIAITPNSYPWAHVTAIFALHDEEADKQWVAQWTKKDWKVGLDLGHTDTTYLQRQHGPAIALYFAFLSTYTLSLVPLAAFSIIAHFLLPAYSLLYALPVSFWALAFVEYWRAKERVLAIEVGTEGIEGRPKLRAESSPMAAEEAWWRRSARVAAGVPVLFLCAVFLAGVLSLLFVGEAFIANLYTGPGQKYIGLLPTVCFSAIVPQILKVYRKIAERLTAFEDHASTRAHADALTRKTFALNSIVAYAGLTLSAFVYIPFGRGIMTGVDQKVYKRATAADGAEHKISQAATEKVGKAAKARGSINKGRLQDQLFAYTVTNQVINAFLELGLPVIMRKVAEFRGQTSNGGPSSMTKKTAIVPTKSSSAGIPAASVHLGRPIGSSAEPVDLSSGASAVGGSGEKTVRVEVSEEERKLLAKIEKEAELPAYDLFTDYAEMVTQFGYVALWSICWPLGALSSLVNNYFEIRGDAFKITHNVQRPIPARVASIGPWLDALATLAQLSAVTVTMLHLLFHPHQLRFRFIPSGAERFLSPSYHPDADAGTSVPETVFPLLLVGLAASQVANLVQRGLAYAMQKTVWEGSEQHHVSVQKTLSVRRAHLDEQQEKVGALGNRQEDRRETAEPFWSNLGVDATEVGQAFKQE